MRKQLIAGILLLFGLCHSQAQSPHFYHYKGKKIDLTLDFTTVNIVADSTFQKSSLSHLGFKDFDVVTTGQGSQLEKLAILNMKLNLPKRNSTAYLIRFTQTRR